MNTWMHSSNPNENPENPEGTDKNISKTFSKIGGYFPKLRKSDQENPGLVASIANDDVQQHIETIEGSNDVFVPVPVPVITSTDDADDHSRFVILSQILFLRCFGKFFIKNSRL